MSISIDKSILGILNKIFIFKLFIIFIVDLLNTYCLILIKSEVISNIFYNFKLYISTIKNKYWTLFLEGVWVY